MTKAEFPQDSSVAGTSADLWWFQRLEVILTRRSPGLTKYISQCSAAFAKDRGASWWGIANPTQIKFCLISTVIHFWLLIPLVQEKQEHERRLWGDVWFALSSTPEVILTFVLFLFLHWSLISSSCWKHDTAAATNSSLQCSSHPVFWH